MMTSPGKKHLLYLHQFAIVLVFSVNLYFKFKAAICGFSFITKPFCAKHSNSFFTMHLGMRLLCKWFWSLIKENLSPQQILTNITVQVLNILYPIANFPRFCFFGWRKWIKLETENTYDPRVLKTKKILNTWYFVHSKCCNIEVTEFQEVLSAVCCTQSILIAACFSNTCCEPHRNHFNS